MAETRHSAIYLLHDVVKNREAKGVAFRLRVPSLRIDRGEKIALIPDPLFDKDEIVRRSGLFGYRTVGLLFRKVQRVTVTQSRYQRRKGLASLRMYMASGKVSVPYIEHETAQRLRDYILYRVESSQRAWH